MPLMRRRAARRAPLRVRRRVGRLRRLRRKVLGSKVHYFTEKCQLTDWAATATSIAYGVQTFKISDLFNFTSGYQQLFDLYKLNSVSLTIFPKFNVSAAEFQNPNAQAGALPLMAVAPNRDPYVPAPTSWNDLLNDDGCKVYRMDKPVRITITRPKPNILDDQGHQLPFQFNLTQQPWLTTGGNTQTIDQSAIKHYGLRWAIWNQGPYEVVFNVVAKYSFCFKEQD